MAENARAQVTSNEAAIPRLGWVADAVELRQPLNELHPIWVRSGAHQLGLPNPTPEWHPYCEFGIMPEGEAVNYVRGEHAKRLPGDILLAGPGVPHRVKVTKYPCTFITAYFLPSVLIELGPASDGPQLLRRLTAPQSLQELLVRPSEELRMKLMGSFGEMLQEFEGREFGREIKLRTLLMDLLVEFLRWERRQGRSFPESKFEVDWKVVGVALEYLRNHYAEPVYAQDLARTAGISESKLKVLFKNALGIPWCKYLQSYRIHRAMVLLGESRCSVSEAAYAAGFESLSHFDTVFRSIMGCAPSDYAKQLRLKDKSLIQQC
ncbi:MAG: AraC family transcriptional regulator [Candidatus Omnitrophica bacterium]|nr:AraC family transcriptional regulator [Candidatus Omnitrophota bacterium]